MKQAIVNIIEKIDTRDIIALGVIGAYVIVSVISKDVQNLKEAALLVLAFYFVNKATKDKME